MEGLYKNDRDRGHRNCSIERGTKTEANNSFKMLITCCKSCIGGK